VIFGECHDQSLAREVESTARSRPELKIRLGPLQMTSCSIGSSVQRPRSALHGRDHVRFDRLRHCLSASGHLHPLGNIPDVIKHRVTVGGKDVPEIVECINRAMDDPDATHAMVSGLTKRWTARRA